MRPPVVIDIERDPARARKKRVVLHSECGSLTVLAADLTPSEAARLLIPLRKAFLSGVQWMREDASTYVLSALPNVQCAVHEAP